MYRELGQARILKRRVASFDAVVPPVRQSVLQPDGLKKEQDVHQRIKRLFLVSSSGDSRLEGGAVCCPLRQWQQR